MRPGDHRGCCTALLSLACLANAAPQAVESAKIELLRGARSGVRPAQAVPVLPEDAFPNLIRDQDFPPGSGRWRFWAGETGASGRLKSELGLAHLSVEMAATAGTVYLSQQVDLPEGTTALDFRVRARDAGAVEGYAYILREIEADGRWVDTVLEAPATRGVWREHAVRWHAKTIAPRWLLVHLRFLLQAGVGGKVVFGAPSLRSTAEYEWRIDGAKVPSDPLTLDTTGLRDGPHTIELAVLRSGEQRLFARLRKDFASAPLQPVLEVPALVLGRHAEASGVGSFDPEARDLLPLWEVNSARQAWRLVDETGGQGTVSFIRERDGGTDAVLRVARNGADRLGGAAAYLLHEMPVEPLKGRYQLTLRRRVERGMGSFGLMIRELGVGAVGYLDSVVETRNETLTPGWAWSTLRWQPHPQTRRVQVMFRFRAGEGSISEARFRDVTLRPALWFHWDVDAQPQDGDNHAAQLSRLSPGLHTIRFAVSRQAHSSRAEIETQLVVVKEPPVVCAVGTAKRLLWRPGANLSGVAFELRTISGERLLGPLAGPAVDWVLDLPPDAHFSGVRVAHVSQPLAGIDAPALERNSAEGNTLLTRADDYRVNLGESVVIRARTCGEELSAVPMISGKNSVALPTLATGGGWFEAVFAPSARDAFRVYRPWGTGRAVWVMLPPTAFSVAFYLAGMILVVAALARRSR